MSERITFSLMRVPNDMEQPPRPAGIVVFDNPSHGVIVVSGSHRHQMLYEALLSTRPELRESREAWQNPPSLRNEPAFCVGYTDRMSVNPIVSGTHCNKKHHPKVAPSALAKTLLIYRSELFISR